MPDLKNAANKYPFLVQTDGERIFAVRALGGIERGVGGMTEVGASVPVESLSLSDAGLRGKAITLHSILRRTIQVADREEKEKAKAVEAKAVAAAAFQKRIDDLRAQQEADRQILRPKGTLTDEEFLMDRKQGIWFMDFGTRPFFAKVFIKETNRREDRKVHGLMALLERDEAFRVRVIECPEALNEFFVGHREFTAEGDNFYGLGKLGYAIRELQKRLGIGVQSNGTNGNGNGKKEMPSEVSGSDSFVQAMMSGEGEDPTTVMVPVPEEVGKGTEADADWPTS